MKHTDKSLEDDKCASEIGRGAESNKEPNTGGLSAGESRRRFVKGTLAAAPILMTVASRPAWGNVCAPSGMVSGNLSSPGAGEVNCTTGLAPNSYINPMLECTSETVDGADIITCEWALNSNAPSAEKDWTYNFAFDVEPLTPGGNGNHKLKQVLVGIQDPASVDVSTTLETFDDWKYNLFDRCAVTACFNAVNGLTPYLTPYMVKCMVRDARSTGYEVAPGCIWNEADVLAYFMYTWGEGPLTVPA